MKSILCYGDSLTWGAVPGGARHSYAERWPTVLGQELGANKVHVVAEGLGGRNTVFDDFSAAADRNGARILPTLLATHQPLDCVIIMLGTNDMKPFVAGSAPAAARGMKRLVEIIRTFPWFDGFKVPEIVLVAPPHCVKTGNVDLGPIFAGAPEQSAKLALEYQRVAVETGCEFFDAASVAVASPVDGVHLDAKNTIAIGKALAPLVKNILEL
ncbi:Arylesterase [hydrothermal vent metagenome]|uniref:Arylesterase n=1 Tax=hydrothermal vent metagenome TaxID=652676 RepID=A0A3B0TC27_9ZZZZ